MLELSTVLALTQLGIQQSDWWRAVIGSTNLHIVIESAIFTCHMFSPYSCWANLLFILQCSIVWKLVLYSWSLIWPPKIMSIVDGSYCLNQCWFDILNSLWPRDTIWHWRYWSTLVQEMASCLMAPSHYLNQCWLIISEDLWYSPESNFTVVAQDICPWNEFENYQFKITATSPRGQWAYDIKRSCIYLCFCNHTIALVPMKQSCRILSLCKLICRHWTLWNVCQIYFVKCVSKIEHIRLVIHYST